MRYIKVKHRILGCATNVIKIHISLVSSQNYIKTSIFLRFEDDSLLKILPQNKMFSEFMTKYPVPARYMYCFHVQVTTVVFFCVINDINTFVCVI